ncbi:restriction endonuclease subunit S [Burkholderia cenocepacia]|nr:restriction endonuclease subunit S [Burkholderia cenocepacia]RQZ92600.1 restriction endonuclease subunit S [Burkholderia cenocepacia]RRA13336.1 restriction endonuclease subunit S [Burkholderia cenocepacia]
MSVPTYPNYKGSGLQWLGDVPAHWKFKRLRVVAELNPSRSEIDDFERDEEVSFLPMEAIGDDGSLNLERTRPIRQVETGYTYFRDGDVTLAKITPCFENGKGALMRGLQGGVGFGTTELIVVRPRPAHTSGEYLNWIFRSPGFRQQGEASMYGAGGQKRVPDDFVRNFAWAFPPLPEQTAIAAFLDRETSKINSLIAEQEKLLTLLTEKRQATISHAVTRGLSPDAPMKDSGVVWLGDVPAHWKVVPLAYRYNIQLGKMLDSAKITGDHLRPYLRVFDVQWGYINTDELPVMDFDEDAREKFRLAPGDILVNEGGSYPGRSAIWRGTLDECYYQKALHRLRPYSAETDTTQFFYYVLFWAAHHGVFSYGGNETTIEHLPAEKLRRYRFAFPPIEEQSQIATFLNVETAKLDALRAEAERAIDLLKERRSALIASAVTGKIDVRGAVLQELAA